MPDDSGTKLDMLLETVWRKRYTTFVTVYMELRTLAPELCHATGFSDCVLQTMGSSTAYRRQLTNDPEFLIWLNLTMGTVNGILTRTKHDWTLLRKRLSQFSDVCQRFDERRKNKNPLRVPGTQILVQRFDIAPLIASATPPSYVFPSKHHRQRELEREGYSLLFFKDVVTVALDRIRKTWPQDHRQFKRLVKVIGYLPDARFRSCSASRYTGVIYLAARDNSIMDIEESLVHEGGHQLVYNIVEAEPLVRDDKLVHKTFTLPWSGQRRDFYGYFHAFYIYILLVKYFERVTGRSDDEQRRVFNRMIFILRGLIKAIPDFKGNRAFTPRGGELFRNLEEEICKLQSKHHRLLKERQNASTAVTSSSVVA